ncbi:MAG: hypothetical protein AAF267_24545 [Deinococcota bacterium]
MIAKLSNCFQTPLTLTGSTALKCHLLGYGINQTKTGLTDLDILVPNAAALPESLNQDFLVAHFHPLSKQGRMPLQLVEKTSAVRVDVFTPFSTTLDTRSVDVILGDRLCKLVSVEDLAARLLAVMGGVLQNEPIDPKYVESFKTLRSFVNTSTIDAIWKDYRKAHLVQAFEEVATLIQQHLESHPELLKKPVYNQNVHQSCSSCQASTRFPLASRAKIYDMIGFV